MIVLIYKQVFANIAYLRAKSSRVSENLSVKTQNFGAQIFSFWLNTLLLPSEKIKDGKS
jgi:hypothetical protein